MTRARTRLTGIALLAALAAACHHAPPANVAAQAAASAPADAERAANAPAPDKALPPAEPLPPLEVWTSWCSRAACEVTFTFDAPMVRADVIGEILARAPAKFEPAQLGAWRWSSSTELVFQPDAEAHAMWWGHHATARFDRLVSLDGRELEGWEWEVWVPNFEVGDKWASWPTVIGRPRAIGMMRVDMTERVGAGPMLLVYDQPVELATVRPLLQVRDETGAALPVTVARGAGVERFYQGTLAPEHVVGVTVNRLPEDDSEVVLQYPTWDDESGEPSIADITATVRTRFALEDVTVGWDDEPLEAFARLDRSPALKLFFSSAVSPASIERYVRISPEPVSRYVWV